jgi:hypothetical protein
VTARGLTTSFVPYGGEGFEVDLDLRRLHADIVTTSGATERVPFASTSVAAFHDAVLAAMDQLGMPVAVHPVPSEIADATPFPDDTAERVVDPGHADALWRALVQAHRVFTEFRAGFVGKVSPVRRPSNRTRRSGWTRSGSSRCRTTRCVPPTIPTPHCWRSRAAPMPRRPTSPDGTGQRSSRRIRIRRAGGTATPDLAGPGRGAPGTMDGRRSRRWDTAGLVVTVAIAGARGSPDDERAAHVGADRCSPGA